MASAMATSVPGRAARWMSARLASGVRRGSMTTTVAPSRAACRTWGTRWNPEVEGLAPQMTMSRAWR